MPPTIASGIVRGRKRLSRADAIATIPIFTSVALGLGVAVCSARLGDQDLGNGFVLVRDKQVHYVLGPPQSPTPGVDAELATKTLAVPPNVTQLTQIGDIVAGVVEFKPACTESIRSDCGLFVLDTKTCDRRLAMPHDQWEAWLSARGIDASNIRVRAALRASAPSE